MVSIPEVRYVCKERKQIGENNDEKNLPYAVQFFIFSTNIFKNDSYPLGGGGAVLNKNMHLWVSLYTPIHFLRTLPLIKIPTLISGVKWSLEIVKFFFMKSSVT